MTAETALGKDIVYPSHPLPEDRTTLDAENSTEAQTLYTEKELRRMSLTTPEGLEEGVVIVTPAGTWKKEYGVPIFYASPAEEIEKITQPIEVGVMDALRASSNNNSLSIDGMRRQLRNPRGFRSRVARFILNSF